MRIPPCTAGRSGRRRRRLQVRATDRCHGYIAAGHRSHRRLAAHWYADSAASLAVVRTLHPRCACSCCIIVRVWGQ
jgi:hypothetical protein